MNEEKYKLMVVDDDPSILITLRTLFETEGFDVCTVTSGQECLDELQKGFKGVILMDIMMPYMDGWETIRQIIKRNLLKGNIISMLTARDDPGDAADDLKEYVIDYITKPFDGDQLIRTVKGYYSYLKDG